MQITAGVIGCGSISRFHFSGLEKAGARVKWVCDLSEAAARPWAEKCGATFAADYRAVLADPEVNTVVVTPVSAVHTPRGVMEYPGHAGMAPLLELVLRTMLAGEMAAACTQSKA